MRSNGLIKGVSLSVVSDATSRKHVVDDDQELLRACSEFEIVDAELDRLTQLDSEPPEHEMLVLHRRWSRACWRCSTLDARTIQGRRAKAKVLLSTMQVAFGGNFDGALPHELLALSLAQDLVVRGPAN